MGGLQRRLDAKLLLENKTRKCHDGVIFLILAPSLLCLLYVIMIYCAYYVMPSHAMLSEEQI